jgi:CRP-like cAMP-binding protein
MKQSLADFIRQVYPMPPIEAERIAAHFQPREFGRNELLLREGKVCQEYYFLDAGFIRSFTHDLEGNEVTIAFYPEKGVVCELFSFFKRVPARESFQALTDCRCLSIDFAGLQEVFHSLPEFREFGRTILVNAYAQLKVRMLSSLHLTAEERYHQLIDSSPDIFQMAPLKYIASYLGVTDTSLSRIRAKKDKKDKREKRV